MNRSSKKNIETMIIHSVLSAENNYIDRHWERGSNEATFSMLSVLSLTCIFLLLTFCTFSQGIGIGSSEISPDGILHVDEGTSNTEFVIEKDDGTLSQIIFDEEGTQRAFIRFDSNEDLWIINDKQDQDIVFTVDVGGVDTEVMRMDASEYRVGIGTTTPDGFLHVDNGTSNTSIRLEKDDATEARIIFDEAGTQVAFIQYTANEELFIINDKQDQDIIFKVDDGGVDTEVMRIDASVAKVGIGTTTPDALLTIEQDDGTNAGELLQSASSAVDYAVTTRFVEGNNYRGGYINYDASGDDFIIGVHDADNTSAFSDLEVIRIKRSDGLVGILVSADPTEELEVNGTIIAGFGLSDVVVTKMDAPDDVDEYDAAAVAADPSDNTVYFAVTDDADTDWVSLDDGADWDAPGDAAVNWISLGQPDATARIMGVSVASRQKFDQDARVMMVVTRMDDGNVWVRTTTAGKTADEIDDTAGDWGAWINFGNPGM